MRRMVFTITTAALWLAACNPESPGPGQTKLGLIRGDCGPTDGAATRITLSDSAMQCGAQSAHGNQTGMILDGWPEDLKIGFEYRNIPLARCGGVDCVPSADTLDIQFSDTAGTSARGAYRIRSGKTMVESGNFELKKCHEQFFCP